MIKMSEQMRPNWCSRETRADADNGGTCGADTDKARVDRGRREALESLIIALDPPPQFCQVDETIKGDILGQGGKPILGRLGFGFRPLDPQPLNRRAAQSAWYRDAPRVKPVG